MASKAKLTSISKKLVKYLDNRRGDGYISVDVYWTKDSIKHFNENSRIGDLNFTCEYKDGCGWEFGLDDVDYGEIRGFIEDKCTDLVEIEDIALIAGDFIIVIIQYS